MVIVRVREHQVVDLVVITVVCLDVPDDCVGRISEAAVNDV
jgi:hypothetical protein